MGNFVYSDVYNLIAGFDKSFGALSAAVSEWLRSQTRNLMGYARTGSNPVHSDFFFFYSFFYLLINDDSFVYLKKS